MPAADTELFFPDAESGTTRFLLSLFRDWCSHINIFADWLQLVEAPMSTTLDVRDLEKNASTFRKKVVRRKFACFSPSVPCPSFPNRGVLTKIIDVPTLASNANP